MRGSWRFALLVLLIAIPSNLAQYWWSGPQFGGMSGVVYGLFGYMWMKSRYEPGSGFFVTQNTVIWMVGWYLMCLVGVIPGIANAVHTVGFAVGIVIGRWPSLWHRCVKQAGQIAEERLEAERNGNVACQLLLGLDRAVDRAADEFGRFRIIRGKTPHELGRLIDGGRLVSGRVFCRLKGRESGTPRRSASSKKSTTKRTTHCTLTRCRWVSPPIPSRAASTV